MHRCCFRCWSQSCEITWSFTVAGLDIGASRSFQPSQRTSQRISQRKSQRISQRTSQRISQRKERVLARKSDVFGLKLDSHMKSGQAPQAESQCPWASCSTRNHFLSSGASHGYMCIYRFYVELQNTTTVSNHILTYQHNVMSEILGKSVRV